MEVSCIDEQCTVKNKTAVVQVLDRCPECAYGAIELSPMVYMEITGLEPNRVTLRWRYVDCPDAGNVQVCLKEGSSPNWIAVQPTNGLDGVESVTINDGTYSLTAGKCTDTNKQFSSGIVSQSQLQTTPTAMTVPVITPAPISMTATATSSSTEPQTSGSAFSKTGQNTQLSDILQHEQSPQHASEASPSATKPVATLATSEDTLIAPETKEASTEAPLKATKVISEDKTASTNVTTPSSNTSKCRVKGRHRRN
ncbi:unnamed protein product [Peronospora belbahrii]|uniref:Expansin-like EG45 domain-containing protein n=1 Tax=Peronospora belbahrii TaxID=622444 RepID=A0AAU9LB69_9STRA|nr:unnamed protein product [Peronospora belbahrii]